MASRTPAYRTKIYRAAYNAARRGHTIKTAQHRSRVYSKNPTLWHHGFKAGQKSTRK